MASNGDLDVYRHSITNTLTGSILLIAHLWTKTLQHSEKNIKVTGRDGLFLMNTQRYAAKTESKLEQYCTALLRNRNLERGWCFANVLQELSCLAFGPSRMPLRLKPSLCCETKDFCVDGTTPYPQRC
ncbi:hypothetical protein Baya_5498 [Bagarius yarrelli]|uniref:Uncharacterized protein n=1 Tax=Bagarius yarrelli TaxID=175774 RepID=A0A556TUW2_BAGYA|nr:hypothetical protein Baya_5498 [Bagarius yarrelli]